MVTVVAVPDDLVLFDVLHCSLGDRKNKMKVVAEVVF